MAKKPNKMNQKYLIIALALGLALAGYYGYRQLATPTSINQVWQGDDGTHMASSKPKSATGMHSSL